MTIPPNWTPEPWTNSRGFENLVSSHDGQTPICDCRSSWNPPGPIEHANAERIVACVNACEGLNPEAIPELIAVCEREWRHSDGETALGNIIEALDKVKKIKP